MRVCTHFFYKYVNSKTSLKQFLEQYDNVLRSKVEKDCQAEAKAFFSNSFYYNNLLDKEASSRGVNHIQV